MSQSGQKRSKVHPATSAIVRKRTNAGAAQLSAECRSRLRVGRLILRKRPPTEATIKNNKTYFAELADTAPMT